MTFESDELPDREKAREFYLKYEPKEVLGKGISSVVRRCVEKSTGKEYAVKIVEYSGDELKESTLREIEIMRLIGGHPNISTYILYVGLLGLSDKRMRYI